MSMLWEKLSSCEPRHDFSSATIYRGRVPGGWLVVFFWHSGTGYAGGPASCYYPDPLHEWDGSTLPAEGGSLPAESQHARAG